MTTPRTPFAWRVALLSLGLLAAPLAAAQIALTEATCATNGSYEDGPPAPTVPNGHVAWPADAPVWEFDLYRPANRTTLNGGGLELRDVAYRGRTVLARASVPVLNVEYDEGPGSCGCFRDWQTEEAPIDVGDGAELVLPCLAQAAPGDVRTACEANAASPDPGGDVGDFQGVSVEDYGDELVLTAHTMAGWYRYRMKWHFYADGRVWPEFSFAAADAICTDNGHRHHAYWRLDFDLDGTPANDVVREHAAPGGAGQVFASEASRVLGGPSDPTYWSVVDGASGIGYEIRPGEPDRRLGVDPFSKTDALVLRYKLDELDDGLSITGGGCAFAFEPFVNGESLENQDTVFWIRSGALHSAGSPYECDVVGPMLHPIGFEVATVPGVEGVAFEAARPNPFTGSTTARFQVERTQPVTAELYDLAGRRVQVLFDGVAAQGEWQTVRVDGRTLPAGTYVVRVRGETARGTVRVVLVR
ncbi:T9SS type A sorting domain-containing protein [Rubrivirga sp.]|uniref:T9SS type A sorting domain-containing protein n=1 Tax=Rubrivirga sp. TaxID=1885344 RepID=UPI003B52A78B